MARGNDDQDKTNPPRDPDERLQALVNADEVSTEDVTTEVKRWVLRKMLENDIQAGGMGQVMHGLADLKRADSEKETGGDIWRLLQELKREKAKAGG